MKIAASPFHLAMGMIVLNFLTVHSIGFTKEKAIDKPFYQNESLTIVPNSHGTVADWCRYDREKRFGSGDPSPYGFIVRYSLDHEQRKLLFSPSYEEFVLQHVVPEIEKACKGVKDITENFFIHLAMSNQKNSGGYGDRIWDQLTFRYRDNNVIQTRYAPAHEMIVGKSQEEIDALKLPTVLNRMDSVLAKFGPLTVYPHDYKLCTKQGVEVDVTFDMAGSERDSWIESQYGTSEYKGFDRFFEKDLLPALREKCGKKKIGQMVNVHFYERDSTDFWDIIRFNVLPARYTQSKISPVKVIASHWKGARAKEMAELAQAQKRYAQNSCTDEPFCGLPGGDYLNAIFKMNEKDIRRLDQLAMRQIRNSEGMQVIEDFASIFAGRGVGKNQRRDVLGLKDSSLLPHIAIKYMALYGEAYGHDSKTGACLKSDAISITRKDKTKIVQFENQYGIDQGSVGGDTYGEVYTINKEFAQLCKEICTATGDDGANFFGAGSQSSISKSVINGIGQVLTELDCNSPDLKQFERNLIVLTEGSLRRETKSSTSTKAELSETEQAQSATPQVRNTRTPRSRADTRQAQASSSQQNEPSRMVRLATQPVIDESVLYDLNGNLKAGVQFLSENRKKEGVIETDSGLQYRIIKSGSGRTPETGDQVTAHMHGTLINGHVFSDTYKTDKPLNLAVGQLIKGVNEGLRQVNEGGKIQLFIPPTLAYGNQAAGSNIPAGSTLIYEIELISIN